MNTRDKRQEEFANIWFEGGQFSILNLCPRFGKIKVSFHCINLLDSPCSILIAYPNNAIKQSWINEFERLGYENPDITYTTYLSLKKYKNRKFDIVILDEIHEMSSLQIETCREDILSINNVVLGLSGTISSWTERILREDLNLPVIARYPIEKAIEEGVIADYEIEVVKVPLSRVAPSFLKSEKKIYDKVSYVINKLDKQGKDTKFMRLRRMRLIQHSKSKITKTKELLDKYKDERVLVFCGLTEVADKLGIDSYHSKSTNKHSFKTFLEGKIDKLAVCRIGNTGVTYTPLNRVIINYTSSNPEDLCQKILRACSMEYGNPEKKAKITIVSTTEPVELQWISRALEMFEQSKITYH